MKQAVPLGRVAGVRVGMHWSVLVMVIMVGWLLGGQIHLAFPAGVIAAWRPSTREHGSVSCAGTHDHAAQEQ